MTTVLLLALRELRHEWLPALCFVAALVGGLAPLLIILALKNGVIDAMVNRLVEDPANREIIAIGAGAHGPDFLARLAARPDVAFVLPATRSINAQANALRNPATRALEQAVTMIPSAPGDPLLGGAAVAPGAVVLSDELARGLGAGPGQQVEILIGREIAGRRETARALFDIRAVLPPEAYARKAVFLSLSDLVATERFRDDPSVTVDGWRSAVPEPGSYASFRLYAKRLEDLRGLEQALRAEGVDARPRAQNAALLIGFRDNLAFLYMVIAVLGVAGFWAAMAANLRGMVARQRLNFSLLALIGMKTRVRRMVPLVQAVVLVLSGIVLTLVLVLGLVAAVNAAFRGTTGETVAHLGMVDVAVVVGLGLLTAGVASVWAIRAIGGIGAADVLREG